MDVTADVKCYHCGHVSGQVIGPRSGPLKVTNFVPRPGFTGQIPVPGGRLRCERCGGPVFLEDVSPVGLELLPRQQRVVVPDKAVAPDKAA
jgi:DNA-directed RNA polymerase subunit RPC12/RpoP